MDTAPARKRLRVLSVEDSPTDATLVRRELERVGYEVVLRRVETARGMGEALAVGEWDVVLADYSLPKFSAPAALKVLRESGHDIPFIIVSGTVGEELAVESLKAGAHDYVMKDRLAPLGPAVEREIADAAARADRRRLAEELRLEQERFRALVEQSSEAISIVDSDGTIRYGSPSTVRVLGYSVDEFLQQNAFSYVHPEDEPKVHALFAGLLPHAGLSRADEFRCRHKNGEWRWVHVTGTNLVKNPALRGVVINYHDTTERKRAEEELLRASNFHLELLNHAPALIWRADREAKCDWFNATWLAFTGRALEQELGDRWAENVHPDDVADCLTRYQDAFRARVPFTLEYRLRRHDGEYRWIVDQGQPFQTVHGEFGGYIGYGFDITERRAAEQRLRANERYYRALNEHALDVVAVIGVDGTVRSMSPSIQRMVGFTADEFVGNTAFRWMHPDDVGRVRKFFAEQIGVPESIGIIEYRHQHKNGTWRVLESIASNLRDDPVVQGLVANSRDVTDRKEAEEQIRALARFPGENPHGVWRISAEGILLYANPAARAAFPGWTQNVGRPAPPELQQAAKETRAAPAGRLEIELHNDGRHFAISAVSFPDSGYANLYARDITERKQAEEELRERGRALVAANAVLERFNQAAVGRELRVIELKKTINELAQRLGERAPYTIAKLEEFGLNRLGPVVPAVAGDPLSAQPAPSSKE